MCMPMSLMCVTTSFAHVTYIHGLCAPLMLGLLRMHVDVLVKCLCIFITYVCFLCACICHLYTCIRCMC
jgi:hypothetical protein